MLETHSTKATAVVESNNAGSGGPPVVRGERGFGGGTHDAAAILQLFSKKIRIFRHILV